MQVYCSLRQTVQPSKVSFRSAKLLLGTVKPTSRALHFRKPLQTKSKGRQRSLRAPFGRNDHPLETASPILLHERCKHPVAAASTTAGNMAVEESTSSGDTGPEPRLFILTTLGCPYCRQTKAALSDAGVPYKELDLSTQLDVLRRAKELTGQRTVPQVFVGGQLVGGSSETVKALKSGKLEQLMRDAEQPALPAELRDLVQEQTSSTQEDLEGWVIPEGITRETYHHLQELAKEMQQAGLGSLHWQELTPLPHTFEPLKARQWLRSWGYTAEETSSGCLEQLLEAHLLDTVAGLEREGPTLMRLVADAPPLGKKQPLNTRFKWHGSARTASKVSEGLRQIILVLYEAHLTADGKSVQYAALAQDPRFQLFVTATAELQAVDPTPLSREERIAFFLNIYNVLIVHAQAVLGGPTNLLARLGWFSSIKYNIGGHDYSADDIEHGILRGNRPASSSLFVLLGHPEWSSGHFKAGVPRLKQTVHAMDKRIHFALNCGAKSCPPIKVYTPETLEEGLQSAAAAFCGGEVTVNMEERTVKLSKIFKWYRFDFGSKQELLTWLPEYLPESSGMQLRRLIDTVGAKNIDLKYSEYDWSLNSS